MSICREEASKLPLSGEFDVIVAGGGPAGFSAAFATARAGLKTLIVEQFNSLGGIAGAGGHGCIARFAAWGNSDVIAGGIIRESVKRLEKSGECEISGEATAFFEVEAYKRLLDEMAIESSCRLLYYTQFADALTADGMIHGIVIQNKSGRSMLRAKMYIDATGDGDVAARAGVPFEYGGADGECQPMTLMFTIGGVDWGRVCEFRQARTPKLEAVWAEAVKNGDMRPFQKEIMGWWHSKTRPDEVGINFTHINHVSALKAEDLTAATIEGRCQAYETLAVYRKYIPGMENAHIVSTPAMVGTRESRRITGRSRLTVADVKGQRQFSDSIGFGSSFIDIHGRGGPGMDSNTWYPPAGFKYQMPYGILQPVGIGNLLVAGRCVSVTHEALGSVRFMTQCGVLGEAAGRAAILCVRDGVKTEDVNIAELQDSLRKNGCIVTDSDIVSEKI